MPARRDNIELVWNITELTGILDRTTNIDGFLCDVVDHIARHMQSDVCSIYLLDESSGSLVLRASHGLDEGAVGEVTLRLGEGITGTAVKELRPIREARASRNPFYKYIPGTHEEDFESFLAVPIRRGLNRIGALVVQHLRPDHFGRSDTRALQAIAGQLAATLENVEMLVELRSDQKASGQGELASIDVIPCQAASVGVAVGELLVLNTDSSFTGLSPDEAQLAIDPSDRDAHEAAFSRAMELTDRQIAAIHQELDERIADIASLIFGSHLLMLHDEEFSGEMRRAIRSGRPAHQAITDTVERYVSLLSSSGNARTREKTTDIRDLGSRLIMNLHGDDEHQGDLRGRIVLAHEMFPSDLVRVTAQHAEGLILTGGGATAHLTILARSLEIPTVLVRDEHIRDLLDGSRIAIDAYEGRIHIDPSHAVLAKFQSAREAHASTRTVEAGPACTADGRSVELLANINILHDVEAAVRSGAQGIGLYRSEFPFLVRNDFPSENEQFAIYRRISERMPTGPLVLRTLDIGGDKVLSEGQHLEGNPFLGLRGIRFSLAYPDLFDEQLRAIIRAGAGRDLRILFPMISSVDEFLQARTRVQEVLSDLADEGIEHNDSPRLGVMIELPSATECVRSLAEVVDFMSIGSNDLVMYVLGVDRTNEQVEHLYDPFHPAVLRAMHRVIATCVATETPVSICGEIGTHPAMTAFLIGVGLSSISADPGRLHAVRDSIALLTLPDCELHANRLLSSATLVEAAAIVQEFVG